MAYFSLGFSYNCLLNLFLVFCLANLYMLFVLERVIFSGFKHFSRLCFSAIISSTESSDHWNQWLYTSIAIILPIFPVTCPSCTDPILAYMHMVKFSCFFLWNADSCKKKRGGLDNVYVLLLYFYSRNKELLLNKPYSDKLKTRTL